MLCWWFKFLSQTSSANTLFPLEDHIPFYFIAHKEMVPHTENNNWFPNRIPVPVNLVEKATRTSAKWQLNNAVQKILHVCLSRNIFQKLMFNSKLESEFPPPGVSNSKCNVSERLTLPRFAIFFIQLREEQEMHKNTQKPRIYELMISGPRLCEYI